jgi:CSLREA domain-containing protein/uncharacterized repeat protein (TIGR01451 family)
MTEFNHLARGIVAALLVAAALALPMHAHAASFTVTKTADTNDGACSIADCSLREAITAANQSPGADTITVPAGVFQLTRAVPPGAEPEDANANGDLDITGQVTLNGAGARSTIISASGSGDRVLHIVSASATIAGVTLRDGSGSGPFGATSGGGVQVDAGATLGLRDSVVTANRAQFGAGIAAYGTVTLAGVTISANSGNTSAGIDLARDNPELPAPSLAVSNSTISGNIATFSGGGIGVFAGSASLTQVTITANLADSNADGSGNGGGIVVDDGAGASLSFGGSILAGNGDRSPAEVAPDCSGTLLSLGYNLTGDETRCAVVGVRVGDVRGAPLLGPLQDNGGPTPTHALLIDSPALDAGDAVVPDGTCLTVDQRGLARPVNATNADTARCDIGAVEVIPGNLVLTASVDPGFATFGLPLTYRATITNNGQENAPSNTVHVTLPAGVQYQGFSGGGWTCALAEATLTCSYGALAAGASSNPLLITVRATTSGDVVTTLQLTPVVLDANAADNTVTLTAVRGRAVIVPLVVR